MSTRITLFSLVLASTAIAQNEVDGPYIPGQVIVQSFEAGGIDALLEALEQTAAVDEAVVSDSIPRWGLYTVKFPVAESTEDQMEIEQVFADAEADGLIEWAEQNRTINAHGQTGSLWVSGPGIDATSYHGQYALEQFDMGKNGSVHALSQGECVLVAVLDTGIDETHPELVGRVAENGINLLEPGSPPNEAGDGEDQDGDGVIDEAVGHGTFISGLITLVAPESQILPIKVLDSDGIGNLFTIAAGVSEAISSGAHVIVLALGTAVEDPANNTPIMTLMTSIDYATSNGRVVVAAVGNGPDNVGVEECLYPAAHPDVIAAGASNHLDTLASFSNYHDEMTLLAPGASVIENDLPDPQRSVIGPLPEGRYAAASGTSFATAFTAGVAALVRAQGVDWPDEEAGVPIDQISSTIMTYLMDTNEMIPVPLDPPLAEKPRLDPSSALLNEPPVPPYGDLDYDGFIAGGDLGILLGAWGRQVPSGLIYRPDVNGDEEVDGADLSLLLGYWTGSGSP